MSSRRLLKAASVIREVVSMAILADLKDPRVSHVTVTHVELSPDMRNAKISVSIMGDEARQRLCLRGLESAAGYLQAKVSDRVDIRYVPRLEFVIDQGVKKSIEIAEILRRVLPQESPPSGTSGQGADKPDGDFDRDLDSEDFDDGEFDDSEFDTNSASPAGSEPDESDSHESGAAESNPRNGDPSPPRRLS